MRILVTGSSGHLGEAICRQLEEEQVDYLGVDLKEGPFTAKTGSIANRAFVEKTAREADFVIHTATLHKPHVATHTRQAFVDTNISGTLNLLEASVKSGVKGFIYTSTTSTFGDRLRPPKGQPAIWVTEDLTPVPKNIYGVSKNAAEGLCQLFYRNHRLPCIILKTSRFFPEADDQKAIRAQYNDLNVKANEYLYRRVDLEDVVSAHLRAVEKAAEKGFQKYIISATSPFGPEDLMELRRDAAKVVHNKFPSFEEIYGRKGWSMFPAIDRVYVNAKARAELGWRPKYDFAYVLKALEAGSDFRSSLSKQVGSKGYHDTVFEDGPYPVD